MKRDDFIEKAKSVHGIKYDYTKVEYKNCDTKVCIICPEHGEFWQTPYKHLNGQGCPRCSGKNRTTDDLIKEFRAVNGDKYDYSKVVFTKMHSKVCVICPEHGEFWITPSNHLMGKKCPFCSKSKMTRDYFIKRAKEVHNNKYDYSKVEYVNTDTKVCIICPEHGEFWQLVSNHLGGHGCPQCGGGIRYNTESFINKARLIHKERYFYSKVEYVNNTTPVKIICSEHGEFWQKPSDHLSGCGCPECGVESRKLKRTLSYNEYIKRASEVHNNAYDYSLLEYTNLKDKIRIVCPIHGEFQQEAFSHLAGCGCPSCSHSVSKGENEIFEHIKQYFPDCIQRDRQEIPPMELDIYIPSIKVAIEYNGLVWHSEKFGKKSSYHLKKLELCKKKGIKLIQIFEDEFINNKTMVFSKIDHILGLQNELPKIFARKCEIKEITYNEAKDFLNKNHIQGSVTATVYVGAFYKDRVIGVMTFKKERNNTKNWELNRFATDNNYICIGVGSKIFRYFTKKYPCEQIKSFADRRWTINETDNLYIKLGFEFDSYVKPDYRYYCPTKGMKRIHKFNCRKESLLKQHPELKGKTETEITMELGYTKVWDCGLIKYVWHRF